MNNKLIRLTELIQEGYPENIMAAFRSEEKSSLSQQISVTSAAIAFHQQRSETLWLKAGKTRTPEEKRSTARAELAAFVFAYLTGDVTEYADSATAALRILGRQGEVDIVKSLVKG